MNWKNAKAGLLALAFGSLLFGSFLLGVRSEQSAHAASPKVIEGWGYRNEAGTAMGCCGPNDHHTGGLSHVLTGAYWRDLRTPDRAWHEPTQGPSCVASSPTLNVHVRLAYVNLRSSPGGDVVVWMECL